MTIQFGILHGHSDGTTDIKTIMEMMTILVDMVLQVLQVRTFTKLFQNL